MIQHLETTDFNVTKITNKKTNETTKILTLSNIKIPTIVFIYSTTCPHCANAAPVISEVAKNTQVFKICFLNVTKNKDIALASLETTTPIKAVPYICAYNDGKPIAIFNGKKDYDSLMGFLDKVKEIIQQSGQSLTVNFMNNNQKAQQNPQQPKKESLDDLNSGMGVPYNVVCSDKGQCYLSFDQIYETGDLGKVPDTCYLTFEQCYGETCKINA
jgi:thioredoxin-like negative regulator of GroEL